MKRSFIITLVLFSLILSFNPIPQVVHGGDLGCSEDAGGCPFDINLGSYSVQYSIKPNVFFNTNSHFRTYAITIPNVNGKMQILETGTKLMIEKNSLVSNTPVVQSNIDVIDTYKLSNTKQASELISNTLSSYRWILNNDPYFDSKPEWENFIPFEFLSGMYGFIKSPMPFYWQGAVQEDDEYYYFTFQGKKGTLKLDNYILKNKISAESVLVDLRFTLTLEYDEISALQSSRPYLYNHFPNIVIPEYTLSAKKTLLDGALRTDTSSSDPLNILEDNDDLTITTLSRFNSTDYSTNHNSSEFKVERKNPAVFQQMAVPIYMFNVYVSYDQEANSLSLGNDNPVTFRKYRLYPENDLQKAPTLSTRVEYKNGEYVLVVPIFNALRLYEDIANTQNLSTVGNLNWNDVGNALKNALIGEIKGSNSDEGLQKIVSEINSQYTTSFNPSTEADTLAQSAYNEIMRLLGDEYNSTDIKEIHTENY